MSCETYCYSFSDTKRFISCIKYMSVYAEFELDFTRIHTYCVCVGKFLQFKIIYSILNANKIATTAYDGEKLLWKGCNNMLIIWKLVVVVFFVRNHNEISNIYIFIRRECWIDRRHAVCKSGPVFVSVCANKMLKCIR